MSYEDYCKIEGLEMLPAEKKAYFEIRHIHEEYDKENGKSIKPSFNYIVVVDDQIKKHTTF